eukprot:Awhi_evm1s14615
MNLQRSQRSMLDLNDNRYHSYAYYGSRNDRNCLPTTCPPDTTDISHNPIANISDYEEFEDDDSLQIFPRHPQDDEIIPNSFGNSGNETPEPLRRINRDLVDTWNIVDYETREYPNGICTSPSTSRSHDNINNCLGENDDFINSQIPIPIPSVTRASLNIGSDAYQSYISPSSKILNFNNFGNQGSKVSNTLKLLNEVSQSTNYNLPLENTDNKHNDSPRKDLMNLDFSSIGYG